MNELTLKIITYNYYDIIIKNNFNNKNIKCLIQLYHPFQ